MSEVFVVIYEFYRRDLIDRKTMKPIEPKDQKDVFTNYCIGGAFETDPTEKAEKAARVFEGIITPCDNLPYLQTIKVVVQKQFIYV